MGLLVKWQQVISYKSKNYKADFLPPRFPWSQMSMTLAKFCPVSILGRHTLNLLRRRCWNTQSPLFLFFSFKFKPIEMLLKKNKDYWKKNENDKNVRRNRYHKRSLQIVVNSSKFLNWNHWLKFSHFRSIWNIHRLELSQWVRCYSDI